MVRKSYTDKNSDDYIWLFELEWLDMQSVMNYEYEEDESRDILPFAFTGHGDKWVFVDNGTDEPYIGICRLEETEGSYYARNFEDAIIRNIIEFVSSSSFCIDEKEAESYQMRHAQLKECLEKYYRCFGGLIRPEYLNIISEFEKMTLKKCQDNYSQWYALLSIEEADSIIKRHLDFPLMDENFTWFDFSN